jgi:epoxide hydrolase-like predicted phosphatase
VITALLFDLGGVVLDSPLDAISLYERDNQLPLGTINRQVAIHGENGAWARHERGEMGFVEFCDAFEAEMAVAGFVVDPALLLAQIEAVAIPRPAVLAVIDHLRGRKLKLGAVTNNWQSMRNESIASHFDVFVESCVEGVRKPDRAIFQRALDRLEAKPESTLVLDDIGPNLKTAREMGMETFKVTSEAALLERLADLRAG